MKIKQHLLGLVAVAFLSWNTSVSAAVITCGGAEREASLGSATQCETGLGNPSAGDILADYPGDAWTNKGEKTSNGTDEYLTANVTVGSWGENGFAYQPDGLEGTWGISAAFWSMFSEAVISMHVGNGNGDPDYFAWLITPNETSGTWSYIDFDGRGGGLSNIKLWGRGEGGTTVAEPNTIMLLGIGMLALGVLHRKEKRKG